MSTANVLTSSYASVATSPRWIISKRDDLIWFIGSAFAGYLALFLTSAPDYIRRPSVLTFVWTILISGPHFYATLTRTYLDGEQRHKLRGFLWLILPFSLLPLLLKTVGGETLIFLVGSAWGTFHVAKQHIGIMMLYKRVNNERSKIDFQLDKQFFLISQLIPLGLFLLWYLLAPMRRGLVVLAVTIQCVLVLAYLKRQVVKFRDREEMNWPKLMLMAMVIPLGWLAFVFASKNTLAGIFIFTIAINFGHSLQYHRLTWFHNRNRYQGKPGLSGFLSRSVIYYYLTVLGCTLFVVMVGPSLGIGFDYFATGVVFMHYFLDGKIWRVREDPELARALRLA